jgi:predicted alpha-1,2-mannosidase
MKKVRFFFLFLSLIFSFSVFSQGKSSVNWVDFVNPYMGNISHLLVPTYPTVHLPNSMMRVYPNRADYTGDLLNGLPVILTTHRGASAFCISPFQGDESEIKPVMAYSYDLEKIKPYEYSVYLDEQQIDVKYAVSHQSAIYQFGFERNKPSFLIVSSKNGGLKWDGKAVSGYEELANNTKVFVYLEPDIAPQHVDNAGNSNKDACIVLHYPATAKSIRVRYGISFIDADQAKKNLNREIADFNLSAVAERGRKIWNDALGKIQVNGGSYDDKVVFYTSLYRVYERPVCISEDGRYFSAFDGKVHNDEGVPFFTDDWIWDTYRAAHPLRVLIDPQTESNIIRSFLRMSEQMSNFWWPTFPQVTGDARLMNSNHGVATVLDAYRKGVPNIDLKKIYPATRNAVMEKTLAPWSAKPAGELDRFYHEHGYIPALKEGEKETFPEVHPFEKRQSVAVTLGTSYDEWCLAQIAKEIGNEADYRYFLDKSYNYRNLFNPATGFFHPKDKDGNFIEPFDYRFSGGMGARQYYDENNGWTYRWDVQHNVADLIHLMGSREQFVRNLDQTFREPLGKSKYDFYAQLPDQTGNVGQFSMANEPSLHIPYLYNYAGQPWKTQKRIRQLIHEWFRNDLMGVPGDEDGGGMSAFVVFSQMGFYPVTPGIPAYNIGSPFFESITLKLANGKDLKIIAHNCNEDNKYIQSATLNGKKWTKPWFGHDDIKNGGVLELTMSNRANLTWGSAPQDAPPSQDNFYE